LRFGVIGAGSWGTAFSKLLIENGHEVVIWARRKDLANEINTYHTNRKYLGNAQLPELLRASTDLTETVARSDIIVLAVPVKYLESVLERIKIPKIVLNLSKGIDRKNRTVSRIVQSLLPNAEYLVLSGPSHAEEVIRRLPTSVVLAGKNEKLCRKIQKSVNSEYFRVYTSTDVLGIEICGSVKNVIAIGAGILDGLGGWDNAKAALMTRGLYEMVKFGTAYGAQNPLTFMGLAGIGDLLVTCMSQHSRNRYVGEMIGKGKKLQDILQNMSMVAEGVYTVKPLLELASEMKIEMPVCQQVKEILYEGKNIQNAMKDLMNRSLKPEIRLKELMNFDQGPQL